MRLKLLIMNLIYIVVSGVCIFLLLTQVFINLTLGYTISRESFKNAVGTALQINTNEVIDEKGVELKLNVKLTSKMCFETALKNDPYPYVKENIIDKNIDEIAATIREPLSRIDKLATIKAVSVQVKASIYLDIYEVDPSANRDSLATSVGITDEYIDGISEAFYDKFSADNATYSESMVTIYTSFEEMYLKLATENVLFVAKAVDISKKSELDEQMATPLKYLGWLGDDNKILGEDSSLCTLIGKIFGIESSESNPHTSEPLFVKKLNSEQKESSSRFADLVKDLIYEKIDPAGNTTGLVFRIIGFIHIFVVVAWGLLALFCIIKSLFKNPGIFIGLFFWLNFIIELFLGIIFVFVIPLLRNVVGLIPIIGVQIATFIKPFTISIVSSTTIPFFCSLGIALSMLLYGRWKRKRKDEI